MQFKSGLLFLVFLFSSILLLGQEIERIINFDVVVNVQEDRSIEVTEYIKVYAAGNTIKRGITRNLLAKRKMNHGTLNMDYEILEIRKNDVKEPYFTESSDNGFTIYIGQKDIYLEPGEYTYMIHYKVPNQIGFFSDYDEIYWNAIGLDVVFPVENASCKVRLPSGAKVIQESAYTGAYGTQTSNTTISQQAGFLDYRINKALQPFEGFTVAIGFDKGFIKEPSFLTRYGTLLIILLGTLFLLPYYFYTWWKYGRDPKTPPVSMRYESPRLLSPASINYIWNNGWYKSESYTASIIALAIKGYLKIEEYGSDSFLSKKDYRITKLKDSNASSNLPEEELVIMRKLFSSSRTVNINGTYNATVKNTYEAHKNSLSNQHHAYVTEGNNAKFIILPLLVSAGIFILGLLAFTLVPYSYGFNLYIVIAFAALAALGVSTYAYLIRKPTVDKLQLQSDIKGYKEYLGLIDDFEDAPNAPRPTTTHFEESLPYAFAMGEEDKWADKFKSILEKANYEPSWNNNTHNFIYLGSFGNSFASKNSTTATKPSSSGSGGSGGGGFSGGGGGGGGVGGW